MDGGGKPGELALRSDCAYLPVCRTRDITKLDLLLEVSTGCCCFPASWILSWCSNLVAPFPQKGIYFRDFLSWIQIRPVPCVPHFLWKGVVRLCHHVLSQQQNLLFFCTEKAIWNLAACLVPTWWHCYIIMEKKCVVMQSTLRFSKLVDCLGDSLRVGGWVNTQQWWHKRATGNKNWNLEFLTGKLSKGGVGSQKK